MVGRTKIDPADTTDGLLTSPQIAKVFNVKVSTVRGWAADGCPVAKRGGQGRTHLYNLDEVKAWRSGRVNAPLDPAKERARKDKASADGIEIKNELLLGNLVDRDTLVSHWGDMVGAARARLLALPTRLATMAVAAKDLEEIERGARELVEEALQELAGDPVPGQPVVATPAEADGEPMGRPVSETEPGGERGAGSVANGSRPVSAGDT